MSAVPSWLAVMRSIDGTHAMGDNPAILGWAKFIGQQYPDMAAYCASYKHDSISWCGLTVAYCMAKAGIRPPFGATDTDRFLWALAWRSFGTPVTKGQEQPGDVLVFVWTSGSDVGGHHVTLYEGTSGSNYTCHGGNQSHAVDVQHYPSAQCVAIRRPPAVAAQMPDVRGQTTDTAQKGSIAVPVTQPASILDIGEEIGALLLRNLVLGRTPIPAEVDRHKAGQLALLLMARAALEQAIAAEQAFTLMPTDLSGAAPDLSGVTKLLPPPAGAPANVQRGITATVFGGSGDPNTSAYDGHVIGDSEPGCALPFHFTGERPTVLITGPAGSASVPIVDVGPWNTNDPYWRSGSRPQAESGTDMRGRPTNHAGIDLTPATAKTVGIAGKGTVDWSFATASSPGATTMSMPGNTNPPQIPAFLMNWKTTAAGAIPILLACVDILQMISSGHFDQTHMYADLGAFAAGFGLVGAQDGKK